jgi:hypothetical protein
MSANEYIDDEAIASGLSGAEIQAVAKRQLVASVAVAVVIALGAGLTAFMPAARDHAEVAAHRVAVVQQPRSAPAPDQHFASARQHEIELP